MTSTEQERRGSAQSPRREHPATSAAGRDGWIDLVAAIVRGTPALPGALCRGQADLFDAQWSSTASAAAELCHMCPDLAPCRQWAATERNLHGVIAGRREVN
ncbi:WhiB family transcriptional regulator [Mycolicibacterium wolinskyi]|uniref:4Fe-4S Wbl-type domain-containing protein n=1 Tax=Mycolicibacterium wolinskyi TaxID=59750 RepID=A0A1X2FGZ6_9MYCO|nr:MULTISPECIES: WhiB family transcriptional regulator [Mycolicibacterium]MCV7285354.1 WhiB family transcriptional regulator [Mycolicibacterium wolinskyi]MCV7295143.1 WhiB family transcriptional regulator [Mycolicibacterium goodii]ORX17712.1 hypothetical protein AWC31_14810 [Mycolicibacterium wolinskyi]